MSLEYSCFLSYRHGKGRLLTSFVDQFAAGLRDYIEPYLSLPVFYDRTDIQGGDLHEQKLADALRASACMICIYIPTYFDRRATYCAREYLGMERIEALRHARASADRPKRSLIIPVVLRAPLPQHIVAKRDCRYDFSKFTLATSDISAHPDYASWFDDIAQTVRAVHEWHEAQPAVLEALDGHDFALPTRAEAEGLVAQIEPETRQPFPWSSAEGSA